MTIHISQFMVLQHIMDVMVLVRVKAKRFFSIYFLSSKDRYLSVCSTEKNLSES